MENHDTSTINNSARYCLVKPGDKVRITKTHRAGIHQYLACEGDTFVITKVVDDQIPYGRWLQPSGMLAVRELKLDPNCCTLLTSEECGVPAAVHSDSFDESFDHWVGAKGVHKFYFGDHMEPSATATTNPHS